MFPHHAFPIHLALCILVLLSSARRLSAAPLTEADREALLENLEKMRETADTRIGEHYRMALNAFRGAMSGSEKAVELYLNCVEKVDFEEQKRSTQDFRDWKRKEEGALARPAFQTALRYQLSWLVLTLQATSQKPDGPKVAADALSILVALFADTKELKTQRKVLEQKVTETVFARAYKVDHIKSDAWPLSPMEIEKIFNTVVLPPLRTPQTLPSLREAWLKRIQFETLKCEFPKNEKDDKADKTEKHQDDDGPSPETARFISNERPKLLWEMEKDLFKSGDESGAAVRMLAHIENNLSHPSAREWGKEFKNLLAPELPTTPTTTQP